MMMKTGRYVAWATLALMGTLAVSPVYAKEKSKEKPAVTVNGTPISQKEVDTRVRIAVSQGQPDSPDLRAAIREDLINLELLTQEAKKGKLDKSPEVAQQIELARKSVLATAFLQDYARTHPITDAQLQDEYDKLKVALGTTEYNVSHILVDSEDEAKAVIADLDKNYTPNTGSKDEFGVALNDEFSKLAKEKSKDAGSAEKGGSLGWAAPSNFVAPFASALLSLKKGEYTKVPVKSQFGWHIIKLDDTRPLKVPSFEELKPQIQQRLQQQTLQDLIAGLRSKAKITE